MALTVSWDAPTDDDAPTMYRVDVSKNTLVWENDIGGEERRQGNTDRKHGDVQLYVG